MGLINSNETKQMNQHGHGGHISFSEDDNLLDKKAERNNSTDTCPTDVNNTRKRTHGNMIKEDTKSHNKHAWPDSKKGKYFLDIKNEGIPLTPENNSFLAAFFHIFDDDIVQDFLLMDSCFAIADSYLLAMVYTYFRRAKLPRPDFTRLNFFAALYLTHDIEEDNEDLRLKIYPWLLGVKWKVNYKELINQRDVLLEKMDYRAIVSKQTCEEVIELFPSHPIWTRIRKSSHNESLDSLESIFGSNYQDESSSVCFYDKTVDARPNCSYLISTEDLPL